MNDRKNLVEPSDDVTTSAAPGTTSRVLLDQRSPPVKTRTWNVLFFVALFLVSIAAILIWTQVPYASVWIGFAAIVSLLLVAVAAAAWRSRGTTPAGRAV